VGDSLWSVLSGEATLSNSLMHLMPFREADRHGVVVDLNG